MILLIGKSRGSLFWALGPLPFSCLSLCWWSEACCLLLTGQRVIWSAPTGLCHATLGQETSSMGQDNVCCRIDALASHA